MALYRALSAQVRLAVSARHVVGGIVRCARDVRRVTTDRCAVDRSHLMAGDRTFLVPVVIDGTARGPHPLRETLPTSLPVFANQVGGSAARDRRPLRRGPEKRPLIEQKRSR